MHISYKNYKHVSLYLAYFEKNHNWNMWVMRIFCEFIKNIIIFFVPFLLLFHNVGPMLGQWCIHN